MIPDSIRIRPKVVAAVVATITTLSVTAFGTARYVVGAAENVSRVPLLDSAINAHLIEDRRHRASDSAHHALQDSLLTRLMREFTASQTSYRELTCHVYGNPRPFCNDQRVRTSQAGQPR